MSFLKDPFLFNSVAPQPDHDHSHVQKAIEKELEDMKRNYEAQKAKRIAVALMTPPDSDSDSSLVLIEPLPTAPENLNSSLTGSNPNTNRMQLTVRPKAAKPKSKPKPKPKVYHQTLITDFWYRQVLTRTPRGLYPVAHPVHGLRIGGTLVLTDAIKQRAEAKAHADGLCGAESQKTLQDSTSGGVASHTGLAEVPGSTGSSTSSDGGINTPTESVGAEASATLEDKKEKGQVVAQTQKNLGRGVLKPKYHDGQVVGIIVDNIYEIKDTESAGLASFAIRTIGKDDIILLEHPLLRTTDAALDPSLRKLSETAHRVYHSLHGFSMNKNTPLRKQIWLANAFYGDKCIHTVYEVASRFNHKCERVSNVSYGYDVRRGVMVFQAKRNIKKGEELSISYNFGAPRLLAEAYGFLCNCGGHPPYTAEEFERYQADRHRRTFEECNRSPHVPRYGML